MSETIVIATAKTAANDSAQQQNNNFNNNKNNNNSLSVKNGNCSSNNLSATNNAKLDNNHKNQSNNIKNVNKKDNVSRTSTSALSGSKSSTTSSSTNPSTVTVDKKTVDVECASDLKSNQSDQSVLSAAVTTNTSELASSSNSVSSSGSSGKRHKNSVECKSVATKNEKDGRYKAECSDTNDLLQKRIDGSSSTVKNAIISTSDFGQSQKILLKTINRHIICNLCKGYLIDATTIVECLHSYCHSCIIKHLRTKQYCPECDLMINTAKPNIKPDTTLQAIVYKLVPGLYEKELLRKRAFYRDRPKEAMLTTPEQRGEDTEHLIFGPNENMSLSLEYADIKTLRRSDAERLKSPKFLFCPAKFTVSSLKKFVISKFGIDASYFNVEIMYKVKTIVLADHYTIMDVAYIYTWKRDAPMRFFFRIKEVENPPPRKTVAPRNNVLKKETISNKSDDEKIGIEKTNEAKTSETTEIGNDESKAVATTSTISKIKDISKENKIDYPENRDSQREQTHSRKEEGKGDLNKIAEKTGKENSPVVTSIRQATVSVQKISTSHEIVSKAGETKSDSRLKIKIVNTFKSDDEKSKSSKSSKSSSKHGQGKSFSLSSTSPLSSPLSAGTSSSSKSPSENAGGDERKVENIKLKIDLTKQNSVTIINMSRPDHKIKKEVTKYVKPEKQWKFKEWKLKKDKDGPMDNLKKFKPDDTIRFEIKKSPEIHRDGKNLVPPITIKAEKPKSPNTEKEKKDEKLNCFEYTDKDEEEKKSEFLNSFALTPIRSSQNSPEKEKSSSKSPPKSSLIKAPTFIPPVAESSKLVYLSSSASKRKSREPVKAVAKKTRCESPMPFSTKTGSPGTSTLMQTSNSTFKIPSPPIGVKQKCSVAPSSKPSSPSPTNEDMLKQQADEKLMPAPPSLNIMDKLKKAFSKDNKELNKNKKLLLQEKQKVGSASTTLQRPTGSGTPRSFVPCGIASSNKMPIVPVPPGTRTPIARRYPAILPKSPRTNPFANLPSDPASISNQNGQEIKPISTTEPKDLKVYGSSKQKTNSSSIRNYALLNASKSQMTDVPPLGCRTPIYNPNSPVYTPSSPIYSPNSPQYTPNYNISTRPTFKYTKPHSSTNYLQSVLENNKQLSGLFPTPPTKKPLEPINSGDNNKTHSRSELDTKNDENSLKRNYPYAKSPPNGSQDKSQEPPEKQAKVQSLLNSCNINIPSSLSITITNEEDEAANNATNLKHKNVNNYIEILKLPDSGPPAGSDQQLPKPMQEPKILNGEHTSKPAQKVGTPRTSPENGSIPVYRLVPSPTSLPSNKIDKKSSPSAKSPNDGENFTINTNPEKKDAQQKKISQNSHDKKKSIEQRKSPSVPKSPKKDSSEKLTTSPPTKKFRPILPRTDNMLQQTTAASSPPKLVPSLRLGKSKAANLKLTQQQQKNGNKKTTSPPANAAALNKKTSSMKPVEILDLTGGSNTCSVFTTTPIKSPSGVSPPIPKQQQQQQQRKSSMLPRASSAGPPPTSMSANVMNNTELTKFFSESLLRQQPTANNSFLPHLAAAAAYNPNFTSVNLGFNYQQAFIMEQFNQMQKAGHEALEKYMLKLKEKGCMMSPNTMMNSQGVTTTIAAEGGGGANNVAVGASSTTAIRRPNNGGGASSKSSPVSTAKPLIGGGDAKDKKAST